MSDITRNTDVVVVGGGLAGLTAASLLASAGREVTLFERSSSVGGRAVTHVDRGFHLNLGPHAWYVGGPGTSILHGLGIPIPGRPPRPDAGFALYEDVLHTLPVGFISLMTTNLLGLHGKLEMARLLASLPRMDVSRFDNVTLGDWLSSHVDDVRARAVVEMFIRVASYTQAPDMLSAGAGLASLKSVLRDNVRYIDGGWQMLVDALHARAVGLGVRIVRGTPVAKVLHDRRVEGVQLDDGVAVLASSVIVAGTPAMARALLPHAPASVTAGWNPIPSKAACLDLALARLPRPAATVTFGVDRPLYYSVHSATADLAPRGGAVIHVAKYLNPSDSANPHGDERELEALMDRLQPGWRSEVVVRRYLPAMTVTHGMPTAAGGGLKGRAAVSVSGIAGLFLAGDWIGNEGTLGNAAVASAARAARLAMDQRIETAAVA